MTLLDTNVLLRYSAPNDPAHATVRAAVQHLRTSGEVLCVVPQNLYEFWAVATRPLANNGLGLSIVECDADAADILATFQLLPDSPAIFTEWLTLVRGHACQGKVAHDARLVAAMRIHGVTKLLTFNTSDFARYPGLILLNPNTIAASLPPSPTP